MVKKREGDTVKRLLSAVLVLCLLCLCACAPAAETGTTTQNTTTTTAENVTTITSVLETTTTSTVATTTAPTTVRPYYTTVVQRPTFTTTTTTTTTTTITTTTTKRVTTTTKPKTSVLRVLSIGNSYSQDAHHYISKLAASEGRSIRTVNLYYPGCKMQKHYESWVQNEAIYQYEVNGGAGDADMLVSLRDILPSEQWDVITLQEASYASCRDGSMQPYLTQLVTAIRAVCPNAELYLHQTWAYADGYSSHNSVTGGSMAAMWSKVRTNYDIAAAETGLPLIPSGEAMFNAQQALNARGKGESIQRDGTHAEKAWGRYLLALVWYKTLTGETPANTFAAFDSGFFEEKALRDLIYKAAMDAVAAYA